MALPFDPLEALSGDIRDERAALAAIARREGLGAEDAVDCVQDAFCTFLLLAQRGELPPSAAEFAPLLGGIVRNAARNARRRHRVARPHVPLPLDAEPAVEQASAEKRVAEAEEHVRLRACVDRLCDTQKAVVTLRMLEERDGEDVAAALGIARGYVDVLLHRAKASLFACMTDPH
jgi:RNA polymerase sigma-70 factor (ECF subfamily)